MTMRSDNSSPTDLTVVPKTPVSARGVAVFMVVVVVAAVALAVWAMREGGAVWAWVTIVVGLAVDAVVVGVYMRVTTKARRAHHELNARALTEDLGVPVTVEDLEGLVAPVGELRAKRDGVVTVASAPAWTVTVVEGPGDRPGKGTHLAVSGPAAT